MCSTVLEITLLGHPGSVDKSDMYTIFPSHVSSGGYRIGPVSRYIRQSRGGFVVLSLSRRDHIIRGDTKRSAGLPNIPTPVCVSVS